MAPPKGPDKVGTEMRVTVFCPACRAPQTLRPPEVVRADDCPACGKTVPFDLGPAEVPLETCPVCGLDRLYVRKDFPRRLGCLIIAIGAALSIPTHFMSLAAVLVAEAIIYPFVPFLTACYRCGSQIRGIRRNPATGTFEHKVGLVYERWEAPARKSGPGLPNGPTEPSG